MSRSHKKKPMPTHSAIMYCHHSQVGIPPRLASARTPLPPLRAYMRMSPSLELPHRVMLLSHLLDTIGLVSVSVLQSSSLLHHFTLLLLLLPLLLFALLLAITNHQGPLTALKLANMQQKSLRPSSHQHQLQQGLSPNIQRMMPKQSAYHPPVSPNSSVNQIHPLCLLLLLLLLRLP